VEKDQAFNVINANTLVPPNHGKILLEYNSKDLITKAIYYSKGIAQETRLSTRGDSLGSAHKITLNFKSKTPAMLAGKSFVIYDNIGAVNVWFDVDFSHAEPVNPATHRSIVINLQSGNTPEQIAQKTALAFSIDSQFIAVSTLTYAIISSNSPGLKPDAYDVSTGVYVKNTPGVEPKSLNSKYFLINAANNSPRYYVWYNVNGAGVDPLLSGKQGIMVALSSGASAETVAVLTKQALDSTLKFLTNIDSETLIITNSEVGVSDVSEEGDSDFLVFIQKLGEDRAYLATLVIEYDSKDNIISVERIGHGQA
jgi:hypothetical protein